MKQRRHGHLPGLLAAALACQGGLGYSQHALVNQTDTHGRQLQGKTHVFNVSSNPTLGLVRGAWCKAARATADHGSRACIFRVPNRAGRSCSEVRWEICKQELSPPVSFSVHRRQPEGAPGRAFTIPCTFPLSLSPRCHSHVAVSELWATQNYVAHSGWTKSDAVIAVSRATPLLSMAGACAEWCHFSWELSCEKSSCLGCRSQLSILCQTAKFVLILLRESHVHVPVQRRQGLIARVLTPLAARPHMWLGRCAAPPLSTTPLPPIRVARRRSLMHHLRFSPSQLMHHHGPCRPDRDASFAPAAQGIRIPFIRRWSDGIWSDGFERPLVLCTCNPRANLRAKLLAIHRTCAAVPSLPREGLHVQLSLRHVQVPIPLWCTSIDDRQDARELKPLARWCRHFPIEHCDMFFVKVLGERCAENPCPPFGAWPRPHPLFERSRPSDVTESAPVAGSRAFGASTQRRVNWRKIVWCVPPSETTHPETATGFSHARPLSAAAASERSGS